MGAKYILGFVALAFLVAAATRLIKDDRRRHPQTRTWLLVSAIFAAVSIWLFTR
jgi:NO-binding membrane sensor protein with MHYT domain